MPASSPSLAPLVQSLWGAGGEVSLVASGALLWSGGSELFGGVVVDAGGAGGVTLGGTGGGVTGGAVVVAGGTGGGETDGVTGAGVLGLGAGVVTGGATLGTVTGVTVAGASGFGLGPPGCVVPEERLAAKIRRRPLDGARRIVMGSRTLTEFGGIE